MNIFVYSSFDDGSEERILKNNWKLYDFINQELKARIPVEHFYKLNLKIKEYKGKFNITSINKNNYVAKAGAEKNPYTCQIKINFFDVKRIWVNEGMFDSKLMSLIEDGKVESFLDTYYYIFFHELGHVVTFFNNFEKYLEFIDDDNDRDDIFDDGSDEDVVNLIGYELFEVWKEVNSNE